MTEQKPKRKTKPKAVEPVVESVAIVQEDKPTQDSMTTTLQCCIWVQNNDIVNHYEPYSNTRLVVGKVSKIVCHTQLAYTQVLINLRQMAMTKPLMILENEP